MNIRDLNYLVALAETRHFGRAAEKCFVSQPTLSAAIGKLESELDAALFERSKRTVTITPFGELVVAQARLAIEAFDEVKRIAAVHADPMTGPFRVGMIPTLGPNLLPLIVPPLQERYPELDIIVIEEVTERLIVDLVEHRVDVALLATDVVHPALEQTPVFDEPFWLVHPTVHRLYAEDDITMAMLEGEDILLLDDAHCLSAQVAAIFGEKVGSGRRSGIRADMRASSLETLLRLVSIGFGCTLVLALATGGSWTSGLGLVAKHLNDDRARRRVTLTYRSSFPHPEKLENFRKLIVENLPNTVFPIG